MESVTDVLFMMRSKGVKIWTDNGQLRYQAARGALTSAEIDKLRALRAEIIAFFQQSSHLAATDPLPVPRLSSDRVPLTFSQQWTWNVLDLEKRHSTRTIAVAMRLAGRLNLESLRQSFIELVRRHESLRTRIVTVDGIPMQDIDEPGAYDLEIVELTQLPQNDREVEAKRLAEELVHEPFSVAVGPLFAAKLLKLADDNQVLVIAMDHMISDGASVGIVLRDIWTMYAQSVRGLPFSLPKMPIQFADYAVWQQQAHQWWMGKHGSYWRERLAGAQRVRLFADEGVAKATRIRMAMQSTRLGEILSTELRELSRRERTTPALSALTVYVALVLRWCNKADLVVTFLSTGRFHPEVENTVGYFAAPLFLRIKLHDDDSFLDLLRHVTKEYCAAYDHADSGRIAVQIPQPEFVSNPRFNWIPQEFNMNPAGCIHNSELDDAIRIEQCKFELTPCDGIDGRGGGVELVLSNTKSGVTGAIWYRADLFALSTIERFERNFRFFAEMLVKEPKARVTAVLCER